MNTGSQGTFGVWVRIGAKTRGPRLPYLGRILWGKYLIINYLTLVLASPGVVGLAGLRATRNVPTSGHSFLVGGEHDENMMRKDFLPTKKVAKRRRSSYSFYAVPPVSYKKRGAYLNIFLMSLASLSTDFSASSRPLMSFLASNVPLPQAGQGNFRARVMLPIVLENLWEHFGQVRSSDLLVSKYFTDQ